MHLPYKSNGGIRTHNRYVRVAQNGTSIRAIYRGLYQLSYIGSKKYRNNTGIISAEKLIRFLFTSSNPGLVQAPFLIKTSYGFCSQAQIWFTARNAPVKTSNGFCSLFFPVTGVQNLHHASGEILFRT